MDPLHVAGIFWFLKTLFGGIVVSMNYNRCLNTNGSKLLKICSSPCDNILSVNTNSIS
jgi:hypothetical protein